MLDTQGFLQTETKSRWKGSTGFIRRHIGTSKEGCMKPSGLDQMEMIKEGINIFKHHAAKRVELQNNGR
jgi:hypothetical protein